MPSAKPVQFTEPWGWSKYDMYDECPAQFKGVYIDKKKNRADSPALLHGSKVHEQMEHYLNGWSSQIPPDINTKFWEPRLKVLKARTPYTEAAWGLDAKWKPLKDWFQPTTWIRAKCDAYYMAGDNLVLIDFKTGKYRVPSDEQIELYALVGHAVVPEAKRVMASFWFLDQDAKPLELIYKASDLLKLRKKFEKMAAKLYNDKRFDPKPGPHCRYCDFSRQKGGTCRY